ncbi:2-octaprenyl-6-methoxyphenyl hydroxylase [Vibrio sp. 10N.286.49.B3]|uniref:2-octaprenyl-6-methoxyphenyl hydroxylase n=1 Tax=Vibrio sp. 10N.286.49.B3 TaxID=1880855 RepID=UPI000C848EB6|nr:2-octaprenyl-6-methoxyphenyl hydroxylase [Vibrio sp. 10N.286.49.B3]PMH43867.1 2-octaprenyl-6-methoxyphenyl hydroxylase [Vibrio sp. 10N.286.49.B3]
MNQYDVVIVGGAMAGSTLALALHKLSNESLSIAIVESYQMESLSHPGFDSRSIALSYSTVLILQNLGLWQAIAPVATAINNIHVSDRSHMGMVNINAEDEGGSALGYVVELADIGQIYQTKIQSIKQIDLLCPESVAEVTRTQDNVVVRLSSGKALQGKLLVSADGANSTCCQQLGLDATAHDFEQVAIIANVTTNESHQGRAFERFTHHGPIALLPMSDQRLSLVWCTSVSDAEGIVNLNDDQFIARLQQEFGWRLGAFTKVGERASYPLVLRYRKQNISHRFAVVGNAAQALHPIAGQGFNLGIRDVASLAAEIVKSPHDAGEYANLMRFSQRRQQDRTETIALTSQLVHLFSNRLPALQIGRNLGLIAMDNFALIKSPLLRRTLGLVKR